MTAEGRN